MSGYVSVPLDLLVAPVMDRREFPFEPSPPEDDLGPALARPPVNNQRAWDEPARFFEIPATEGLVYELIRVTFARPGYVRRLATYFRLIFNGNLIFETNDLSNPDPFPLTIPGGGALRLRWHLRLDHNIQRDTEPVFLTGVPASFLPTCEPMDHLPITWADLRYSWPQRNLNKIARVHAPGHVRLFVEVVESFPGAQVKVGALVSGMEGQI